MHSFREPYEKLYETIENDVLSMSITDILEENALEWWKQIERRHTNDAPRRLFPCELLWCYWHEEGMLVQSMEAIARRFQNHTVGPSQALARFDVTPLQRVGDLLWGYIDDQHRRLGLKRRAYEYMHQYGLPLVGKAVGELRAADARSRFLGSFHTLLHASMKFYKEVDDTTVNEDARGVLNAANELHFVLSEGASNQFGTIAVQARVEMLVTRHLLEQQEVHQFLGAANMVAYPSRWMDPVDTLRRTMRWGDTSIVEFWNLARMGEQILLTVRYGQFGPGVSTAQLAKDWADAMRDPIAQYVHSYRAVTGVDLAADPPGGQIDATPPSVYLDARENQLRRRAG